jgi:hypothetical protein
VVRRRLALLTAGLLVAGTLGTTGLTGSALAAGPGTAPNALVNPSFETAGPQGWSLSGTGARTTAAAHDGTASVSMSGASTKWTASLVPSGPAGSYRVMSAWFRRPPGPKNSSDGAHLELTFYLDSLGLVSVGNQIKTNPTSSTCLDSYYTWAGEWCYQLIGAVVPANASSARLVLTTESNNVGTWLADEVSYGPFTSSPSAVGSQIPPTAPSGTATVNVGATALRPVTPLSFGDGQIYRMSALPLAYDSQPVYDVVRATSHPTHLRFPGGDQTQVYDWEHPESRSGCLLTPGATPASEGCGNPQAVTSIDQFMQFVRGTGASDVLWTLNVSGRAGAFTVKYNGNAPTARLAVTSTALTVTLGAGATDGSTSVTVPFTATTTIGDVVAAVNSHPGYAAAMLSDETARTRDPVLEELVPQAPVDVKSAVTVRVDEGNVHKALRLLDYANNPSSTQVGPSGLTRDAWLSAHGFPTGPYNIAKLELGNEIAFTTTDNAGVDPLTTARKFASMAQAIHAAFPSVKVGLGDAVSMVDPNGGKECCGTQGAQYVFSQVMFREAGPYVDFVVDHPYQNNAATTSFGLLAFPEHLRRIDFVTWTQELFQKYSPDHRAGIDVYLTEYNTGATNSTGDVTNALFTLDFLGATSALGAAEANHHDQFDAPFGSHKVTGSGSTATITVESAAYALQLFAQHWGTTLLPVSATSPAFNVDGADMPHANIWPISDGGGSGYALQPAYASKSADGTKLYLLILNKGDTTGLLQGENNKPLATSITLNGFTPRPTANVYTLRPDPNDFPNSLLGNGKPQLVASTISNAAASFSYTTPTHTATLIELTAQ